MKHFVITFKAHRKRRQLFSKKDVYSTIEEAERNLSIIKHKNYPDTIDRLLGEDAYDSLKIVEVEDFDIYEIYDFGPIDIYILNDENSSKHLVVLSKDQELFEILMKERKAKMRSVISGEYCYEVERLGADGSGGENNRDFVNWLVGVLPKEKEFSIFV
jgi:hypothetical protein